MSVALSLREPPWVADPDFWQRPHEYRRPVLEAFYEAEARRLHSDGRNFDKTFSDLGRIGAWLCAITRLDGRDPRTIITDEYIELRRTYRHGYRAVGRELSNDRRRDHDRHAEGFRNKLRQSEGIGWLHSWEPVIKPTKEGEGILLRVRRDSSVGRAHD